MRPSKLYKGIFLDHFNALGLPAPVQKALAAMQFNTPTPIQKEAIPVALEGHDVIGCAQTGTGKTAAFCIPLLKKLLASGNRDTALVLVPTRELAIQIDTFWRKLTQFSPGMHSALIIGGASMQNQARMLSRNPRILIATPGRLLDHSRRKKGLVSQVGFLVLDEADRMLDMGFAPQLNMILSLLPAQRQTLFFTATWAKELDQLAKKYLKNPVRVTVGEVSRAAPDITQSIVMTTHDGKNETLLDELNKRSGTVLVFARTQSRTDRVARYLDEYGVQVGRMHGGRSQGQRNAALSAFRSGAMRVLVATDIAARGIDVAKIGHVVNYDLPQMAEDYIHRIGRTGRAGEKGEAVSLLTREDRRAWKDISTLLARTGSQVPAFDNKFVPPAGGTKVAPKKPTLPPTPAKMASESGDEPSSRPGVVIPRGEGSHFGGQNRKPKPHFGKRKFGGPRNEERGSRSSGGAEKAFGKESGFRGGKGKRPFPAKRPSRSAHADTQGLIIFSDRSAHH